MRLPTPIRERSGFGWLAAIASSVLVATAATAQTADAKFVRFDTDDGSRFLLAPDADDPSVPPIVHWAMLTPAGPRFDPPGLEGLSFAAARAALNGTARHGSRSWDQERERLAELDRLEWRIAQLRFEGRPVPSELGDALLVARQNLREVSDPVAWQRALRSIPIVEIDVSETPEGSILELTATWSGLRRCAAPSSPS